jgi:hypothetical protein
MQLLVNGSLRDFVEIKAFRAQYQLPDEFRVAHFEPKDYANLGSIEGAAHEMVDLKRKLLNALPHYDNIQHWLYFLPSLQQLFREQLEAINARVRLREVEIDFAAAGFGDVCQAWVYALIYTQAAHKAPPLFKQVYADWLYSTVRLSQLVHPYQGWQIQLITHAYGRIGMMAKQGDQTCYIYDAALACPAEGFMMTLIHEVTHHITTAVNLHTMDSHTGASGY